MTSKVTRSSGAEATPKSVSGCKFGTLCEMRALKACGKNHAGRRRLPNSWQRSRRGSPRPKQADKSIDLT